MKGKGMQSSMSSQVMSRSLAESFERVEKAMTLGSTFRQSSPDRVGISAKAPLATAKEVALKRQLSDLLKEFNALDRQHSKANMKLDEVLEEVKRLRTCHDDKEKEALSLRRALERLRLEKDEESASLATDKAYICKLEAKVAAQATSLDQLEKHSLLRARNKELQESAQSLHAVLASTEAELGARNQEIEKLHIALKVRAEDLRKDGLPDSKPSLLLELANEQQQRMDVALKLAETVHENNRQHEQIEILEENLETRTTEAARSAKQSDEKFKALRQETQKRIHTLENEVTDLKARVQDREARAADLQADLKEARAENQRLQESLQSEQQITSEQRVHLKETERRLAEEQTRGKQLSASLAAANQATEEAKKTAKHSLEALRGEMAVAIQKETKRTEDARKRIAELEDDLEELKRQMQVTVSLMKRDAASELERQRTRASEELARVRKQMLADHEQVAKQLTKDVDATRRALASETEKVGERERALAELRRQEQDLREEINGLHSKLDHFTEVNGEIQSDAQAEQRRRMREQDRASAFARQVAALEAQLADVRKDKAATDSFLKTKLEEALSELRATIEERDQLKLSLQETKSKTQSSSSNHSALVAENKQLRQHADELARAKSAAQKGANDVATALRAKLEQAQVQMREWEAAAARMEAKNERLQALVDAERKSSASLAKQCTSALRALHTTSPPHRAPNHARASGSAPSACGWSRAEPRESAVEPILLNSEARDLELSSQRKPEDMPRGIASRFYDSIDVTDLSTRHVSLEGTFRYSDAQQDSYGEEQVKLVVERALDREESADDVIVRESDLTKRSRPTSRRPSRRPSVQAHAAARSGLDALESLTGFDIEEASENAEENGRYSLERGERSDSAGGKKPVLSLEDLADLAEPYSPPASEGMPSENDHTPYETRRQEDSHSGRHARSVYPLDATSRPASSLGLEREPSHIPEDDDDL